MKHPIIFLTLLALTGCVSYSLEELRQVAPKGSEFQKALAQHYKYFAGKEEDQYDWVDSAYFADKGLQAAYGKETVPENLEDWDISPQILPIMKTARDTLVEVLNSGARKSMPKIAARAQYYFDCWVEEQEEAWQDGDISYCRESFKDTMDLLFGKEPAKKEVKHEEIVAEPEETYISNIPVKPQDSPYSVFFQGRSASLSASGVQTIKDILEEIEGNSHVKLTLNAYTDTIGTPESNQKLSLARAQAVRELLTAEGVNKGQISLFAFGESDIPVKTADNTAEPANQRVEIFVSE